MAENNSHTGAIILVLVIAIAAYFLINKATKSVQQVNQSVKQTYSAGTSIGAVVTNLAPALGQFLSNTFGSGSSSRPGAPPSSVPGSGDSLLPFGGAAFSDDEYDFA